MWTPIISSRAKVLDGCSVAVLPNEGAGPVSLWSPFPRDACPVSGNPILGAVHITYRPGRYVLEVVSVHRLVQRARHEPAAQSIEAAALWLRQELTKAAGVPVVVELWLLVRPGPQLYRVRCG